MALQLRSCIYHPHDSVIISPCRSISRSFLNSKERSLNSRFLRKNSSNGSGINETATRKYKSTIVVASSNTSAPFLDSWKPTNAAKASLSDIVWPSAGAFAAMAVLGKMDQMLATRGISMTIAPLGAVCAVLFITPSAPGARLYNVFMAQICCAAIGVLAFSLLGPGWLARSTALAASIAFMIGTGSVHPPAASLPLVFIDGAKFHHLNFWYALFPGATGCILLCLIQHAVCYLKDNYKF
ncbi:hypothetical protein ACHQM5_008233 [Ranunculus cassubicifolius]